MNSITDLSAVIFSKDLPQSSLIMDHSKSFSADKFNNAPRTLFEEIGREFNEHEDVSINDNRTQQFAIDSEFSWKSLVRRLREENACLLATIQSTKTELAQAIDDKTRLEDIVIRQEESIRGLQDQLDQIVIEQEQQCEAPVITENGVDHHHLIDDREEEESNEMEHETDHARLNNLFERKAQLIELQRENEKDSNTGPSISPLTPFPTHHKQQQRRTEHNSSTEHLLAAVYEAQNDYALEHERRAELGNIPKTIPNANQQKFGIVTLDYLKELGIPHNIHRPISSPASKWRACFTAIVAVYRFRKLISGE
ncbi:hypothetical protein BDA99DRAFT_538107 [Phascolomyces articulosus]|uniref:Uncharacterized protein n=1 Tax=Phascolomyces articulosus TaxID=60185 RepID=A0AAD5PEP2_9FUNG|nr:hypothetical protein BDA99DRAFT_538107 [Phascolomyces articulosus]